MTIVLIVGGIAAVLGLGTCGLCIGLGAMAPTPKPTKTANVYVLCDGSALSGFNCTVTHTSGNALANACWDINLVCENAVHVSGHACQSVNVGGKTTRFVGPSELRNAYLCNRALSTSVDNVTVTTP